MNLEKLETEQSNESSQRIEEMAVEDITALINREDAKVAGAVQKQLEQINALVTKVVAQLQEGGRLIYMGAGTSGRLGILDASECPPTYGVSPDLVQGLIAGGEVAIRSAQEGAEDNRQAGIEDLKKIQFSDRDILVGIAASGRTPYVLAGLEYAKSIGAATGSISCVSQAELSAVADYPIEVVVGAEVVTGSSRMKSGTAQKMVLNMITTSTMVLMGKIYKGYMVDVQPTNEKLKIRARRILQATTDATEEEAKAVLEQSEYHVKSAIIMQLLGVTFDEANKVLQDNHDNIALAIKKSKQKRRKRNEGKRISATDFR